MIETLEYGTVKARKDYQCQAALFLDDWIHSEKCQLPSVLILNKETGKREWIHPKLTFSEYRAIINAKKEGLKILKGTKYAYQRNKCDGEFYTFRARLDLHKIACKYSLYTDEY